MQPLTPPTLDEIRAARERIARFASTTPLLPLESSGDPAGTTRVWLKLECLQSIGSFKIRGASNALASADGDRMKDGVYTASAGNMAQGVAMAARALGVSCRVIVPDSAPRAKLDAIAALGATCVPVPFDDWWSVLVEHGHEDETGLFVHPVSDPAVIAGNGTVGLELAEQLPELTAVVVPYGGGGLSCGIASALRELRPGVPVYAAEVETAAPLAASLQAGEPTSVERIPTFVDGIGAGSLLPEMWPMASELLSGSLVVSIEEVRHAIRRLVIEAKVVAEGAGGASVAAALTGAAGVGDIVAVVSGGNIDGDVLAGILTDPSRTSS